MRNLLRSTILIIVVITLGWEQYTTDQIFRKYPSQLIANDFEIGGNLG